MKLTYIARRGLVCGLVAACLTITCKHKPAARADSAGLTAMREVAQRFIQHECDGLTDRLSAFSRVLTADRDFSMKLLVENNRSAPEVTDFTPRYMEPMGFSLLEITDAQRVLLSCGQFPASSGTSIAEKAGNLTDQAQFVNDKVQGRAALTLQTQLRLKIADSVLYCSGGLIVDDRFVNSLPLANGFKAIIRQGGTIIGLGPGASVSAGTDSTITINETTYRAATIALPFSGGGEKAVLIIFDERPEPLKP